MHHSLYKASHIASLEGLRAVAAFGIVATHVAFQTGVDPATHLGAVLARFDFFVAVFFALSAFLLWRSYGPGTGRLAGAEGWLTYYSNRLGRIAPAYLAAVAVVVIFLPEATTMTGGQVLANATLTQIYVPNALVSGLTQMWSLCVEVAFYAVLPLLVAVLSPLGPRARSAVVILLAALSLGWAYLPFVASTPANGLPNRQIWPPAYLCWFAVGIVAAEIERGRIPWRVRRLMRMRWLWWSAALALAWMAGQEWFGPLGLEHPTPGEFALRILAGTGFAACLLVPYALAPGDDLLATPIATALGRWSYSVFLWHLVVLSAAFPLVGKSYFDGGFLPVFLVTTSASAVVAACSYELVEKPGARVVRRLARWDVERREPTRREESADAVGMDSAATATAAAINHASAASSPA
ncbi:acyltransferase family protein [Corynebacterium uterequi]|uniref:Putative acyltransferase n=1 Tax=Corynebacterium uterequi TaxID=1072256 RepID=A0A0G3HFD6_9CORY|nr:acyltransferase [Corynebacterium uterequi]AKK12029.1 putative acyltransferase [Corynebacterium uterequi]